jgi:membrane protease YdiL (CAAX protease family)
LIRGLGRILPWWTSVVLAAIVFAVGHRDSSLWPAAFVAGLGFGILRYWRDSLLSAVTAHAVCNGVQIALFAFGASSRGLLA